MAAALGVSRRAIPSDDAGFSSGAGRETTMRSYSIRPVLRPGNDLSPVGQFCSGDQRSGSISVLTMTPHPRLGRLSVPGA